MRDLIIPFLYQTKTLSPKDEVVNFIMDLNDDLEYTVFLTLKKGGENDKELCERDQV